MEREYKRDCNSALTGKKKKSESVSHSVMSDSATPWAVAHRAPLSMGFSRQKYWSGLLFPLQGIFLAQGLILGLLHCRQILYCLSHRRVCDYYVEKYALKQKNTKAK